MKRLAAIIFFASSTAHAGFEDSLGVGPEAMSLGGSFAARAGSYANAYYNPAGLAPAGEKGGVLEMAVGAVFSHPTLHASLPNGNVLLTPSATLGGAPEGVADTGGFLFGTRFSVGRPFKIDGLDMGLAIFIPGHLLDWHDRPDDDVRWQLMDDRNQVISVHAGLAYRINKYISLGLSVRALFNTQTNTTGEATSVQLDPNTHQVITHTRLGVDSQVFGQAYPIAGVLVTPVDRLRIGFVYRNKSYANDWGTTRINGVPDLGTIGYSSHFAHYFEPMQLTLAASLDVTKSLDVSADVTWAHWSEALSNNLNFWGPGRWGDTIVPALGVRWKAAQFHSGALAFMAGYRYQRSPIDNLGGPSNMLDCDRHVESLGLDVTFSRMFRLTAGLQYTVLVDRTEVKDPRRFPTDALFQSNPGYPSYTYGGHALATQATLEARW